MSFDDQLKKIRSKWADLKWKKLCIRHLYLQSGSNDANIIPLHKVIISWVTPQNHHKLHWRYPSKINDNNKSWLGTWVWGIFLDFMLFMDSFVYIRYHGIKFCYRWFKLLWFIFDLTDFVFHGKNDIIQRSIWYLLKKIHCL